MIRPLPSVGPAARGAALAAACWLHLAAVTDSRAAMVPTITATPTFHNVGVQVLFPAAPDPDTSVSLHVRGPGDAAYRAVQPLCRLDDTSFAGSAIRLRPGTPYSLRLRSDAFPGDQVLSVTTRPETFPAPAGPVFHVATTGHDTNSGLSLETAFRTVGRALAEVEPGVTILLHEGRYFEGDLYVPAERSGTAANPVVLAAAPGAAPVLDGTDPAFVPSWTLFDAARGVYRAPCSRSMSISTAGTCSALDNGTTWRPADGTRPPGRMPMGPISTFASPAAAHRARTG